MSLQLKISATEQKNSFIVMDCTGKYSGSNTGGLGIPNIQVTDIETAILTIITPKQDSFDIDVNPDFPNGEGIGYEVLPYMISMKEIESGEYKIKLTITGTDKKGKSFTKTAVCKAIFTNTVFCCVDKLISKNVGTENVLKRKEMVELNASITAISYAIRCEKNAQAVKAIDLLKAQCECCNCNH